MDTDLEELKQEVEKLKAVTVDTNKMVHGMRRGQHWRSFMAFAWWAIIIGASAWSYYLIQPYITQATAAYGNTRDLQVQVQDWFAKFGQTKAQ